MALLILCASAGAVGKIVEFPVTSTCTACRAPFWITAGPDGNLWFTDRTNQIGRITTRGTVTEFPIPTYNSEPWGIAAGADGNLWFAEFSHGIGRITPSGAFTSFQGPTGSPESIAPGPDGNLWFTEPNEDNIGRITRAGAVTEFSAPTGSYPVTIAPGPDGNLWFAEQDLNRIGRITTAGAITEFPIPLPGEPEGIAPGADGNLWFTEVQGTGATQYIGRITTSGAVTGFPVWPGCCAFAWQIAPGVDGNLWFTEPQPRVSWIATDGTVRGYTTIPTTNSQPNGIVAGPDGNMWLAETAGGNIARITANDGPGYPYVLSLDAGFVPRGVVGGQQLGLRFVTLGATVRWLFLGGMAHSVTDASGMGLFSSGTKEPGSLFSNTFTAAGDYYYTNTKPALTGIIAVAINAAPTNGTTTTPFTITWASAPPPAGLAEDIRIKRPGASGYTNWKTAQTGTSASFTPDAGSGSYSFDARLRNTSTGAHSSYSPAKTITVT